MNINFFHSSLLCIIALVMTSLNAQEVPTLRSLALDKATDHLYEQLKKHKTVSKREELIEKWEDKSGLVKPKDDTTQQTVLERFEQKYFTNLLLFKAFNHKIRAITRDNTKVILTDFEKNIILRDLETDKNIYMLRCPGYVISNIVLNSDNTKALFSVKNDLILWSLNTGQIIRTFKGHGHSIRCCQLTTDESKAISASDDGVTILWDINTGNVIHTFRHRRAVNRLVITSDNNKAISTSEDLINLWDLTSGRLEHTFEHNNLELVNHIDITSNNSMVISASNDKRLILWDLDTGQPIHTLTGHKAGVNKVALNLDGSKAISASNDGNLIYWDLKNGLPIRILKAPKKFDKHGNWNWLCKVALFSDTRAISTSRDETVILWDLKTGNKLYQTKSSDSAIAPLLINNNLVASGTKLFKTEDWKSIIANMPQPNPIFDITMNILNLQQASPLTGISQVSFLKQKKASKSVTQKIMSTIHYFKNRLVSLYK